MLSVFDRVRVQHLGVVGDRDDVSLRQGVGRDRLTEWCRRGRAESRSWLTSRCAVVPPLVTVLGQAVIGLPVAHEGVEDAVRVGTADDQIAVLQVDERAAEAIERAPVRPAADVVSYT